MINADDYETKEELKRAMEQEYAYTQIDNIDWRIRQLKEAMRLVEQQYQNKINMLILEKEKIRQKYLTD